MCKKRTKLTVLGIFAVMLLIMLILAGTGELKFDHQLLTINSSVTVEDGFAYPDAREQVITIDKTGTYEMSIDWESEKAGMITGFKLSNEKGEIVYAFAAEWIDVSCNLDLEKGVYDLKLDYLCSEEEWTQFMESIGVTPKDGLEYAFVDSGVWQMQYNISYYCKGTEMIGYVVLWTLLGFTIAAFICILLIKDNTGVARYDERQELIRGRAFKCGFVSALVTAAIIMWYNALEVISFLDMNMALMTVIFIGITVYAVYCIWNDAYFALNEGGNHGGTIMIFFLMGMTNLIIGLNAVLDGEMLLEGTLTIRAAHFLIAVLAFSICITYWIKKFLWDRKEEQS